MIAIMSSVAVPSAFMAKQQPKRESSEPDHEVRLTAVLKRSERFRIRVCALRAGENLEDMAARWLLERLAVEEKKAGK